ncbi:putative amidase family protein [Fusarium sporotrichioides]|uniref:Putative amidase family protein n=1 Tax=Fusarium sporotrichioides TaxID=5514 RepID=A0A395RNP1_FUSSP|nr:putative amidase family protein [Fusarium sporotrichioides]
MTAIVRTLLIASCCRPILSLLACASSPGLVLSYTSVPTSSHNIHDPSPLIFQEPQGQKPIAQLGATPSLLSATAQELQQLLKNGSLTSQKLVELFFKQIEAFGHQGPILRAMIKVAPRGKLLLNARELDDERQRGKIRGPLHGIPIILKLLNADLIVIGKADLSARSTYVFEPIKKEDKGLANPTDGQFQVVPTFETIGGMAKSVEDLADITDIILRAAKQPRSSEVQFEKNWEGIRLGFVDPPKFKLPDFLFDSDKAYLSTIEIHPFDVKFKGVGRYLKVLSAEVRDTVDTYLAGLGKTSVRTLQEIIDWNEEHPKHQAGIDQAYFIAAQNDTTTLEELKESWAFVKQASGTDGIFKVMDELKFDAIYAPTDGLVCTLAAMAGNISENSPLSFPTL